MIIGFFLLAFIFVFRAYINFNQKGLKSGLVGMVSGDRYPNWESKEEVSPMDYHVLSRNGLYFSKVYLIKRATHFQVRFRIAYAVPFMHQDLLNDTKWIITDSAGNDYTNNIVVYTAQIAGLNCINVTLVLDEGAFSVLSGKEITFSAICSGSDYENSGIENSYAHCTTKIFFPE